MEIQVIAHGSAAYEEAVRLRDEILRRPLGLTLTHEQLAAESNSYHLAGYLDGVLCAYCMLTPQASGMVQMRQVAVADSWRGQGFGRQLAEFAERYARELDFELIYCHARDVAVSFYEKLGYSHVGEPFEEVTIIHHEMRKRLR